MASFSSSTNAADEKQFSGILDPQLSTLNWVESSCAAE
jgi:hypothetical protein